MKPKYFWFLCFFLIFALVSFGAQKDVTKVPRGKKQVTQFERQAALAAAKAKGHEVKQQKLGDAPMAPLTPGAVPHYFSHPNYANSPLPIVNPDGTITGGIRKFVDTLAGIDSAHPNTLGQYIPVAVPDTTSYPESDYYEIALVEYTQQFHTDLPATKLRGYVQRNGGDPNPHYLGPIIVAQKNRPVRIKFTNELPTGAGGNLFIPVDTTVMGSGMGPNMNGMEEPDPQNPMCGQLSKPMDCYTENRATLHLHGGITPWISDGTPHQWITPANENTPYPQGVSVQPVPDMNDDNNPSDGSQTFYYTNQQSARLMFYHDHAYGITRLNVYAGEAAGYLLQDDTELSLVGSGVVPADIIPLVVQDKTFVPSDEQLAISDETWDTARWGGFGQLWLPHVYSPAQNPGDPSGVNQFGRWAYGPWFWPPTQSIAHGPIANPYYDPACDPDLQWCEPYWMPGTPYLSMGMEAFNDTPMVNGTVYPTITLEARPYRFRILSAANDRFFNLHFYVAVDANGVPCDANNTAPAPESTGVACTEVSLNPDEVAAAKLDPAGVFPTPMPETKGPDWIQIGTEGGFLPMPVVVPPQHITWVTDPTVFNAGNVDKHSLLLGPAERADVIVDFSAYAGKTLILYNDGPAAFPARDPRYDYYTDNADLTETGGAPTTLRGYGPNTRTVMQIKIEGTPSGSFDLAALNAAFSHHLDVDGNPAGVFESSNDPIVVGQKAYNDAYGTTFNSLDGLVHIFDTSLTFKTLLGPSLTMPLKPKMIQDEMGEAFELDYGRMSGMLGVETPNPQAGVQNMILYPYPYPPTEILDGVDVPGDEYSINVTPIATTDDGTQIWKITHNGVDTHPVHWHMYNVQLINRVGWDGIIRKPDLNELGWKDTVRVSPLEDTIIAVRPIMPHLPWDVPNSIRLLDPTMPEGSFLRGADTTAREAAGLPLFAFDPNGEPIDIMNHKVNFGWEYVWHCHILSHEEMDMMRSQVVGVAPKDPINLTAARDGNNINLIWTDASKNETSFTIERALGVDAPLDFVAIDTIDSTTGPQVDGLVLYTDTVVDTDLVYSYRVRASNLVGDAFDYSDPNLNEGASFPTMNFDSGYSNIAASNGGVLSDAPSNLAASNVTATSLTLNWQDNSTNENGFKIQRATDPGFTQGLAEFVAAADVIFYDDSGLTPNTTYYYHVLAFNAVGDSPWSATLPVTTLDVPPNAPSNLSADNITVSSLILHWQDNSNNENSFRVERATSSDFVQNFASFSVAANATSYSDGGLTQSTTYYYRVFAVNGAGDSLPSETLTVATANPTTPPARPTNLTAQNVTQTTLTLSWQDNSDNEDGFTIQRATNQGFTQNLQTFTVGRNVDSFNDSGLSPNTRYYYRVRAFNVIGNSQWSPVLNVKTLK